jgi:hypothetical protein
MSLKKCLWISTLLNATATAAVMKVNLCFGQRSEAALAIAIATAAWLDGNESKPSAPLRM